MFHALARPFSLIVLALPVLNAAEMPRVTSDWKWPNWTGLGRVVRPIEAASYQLLLSRLVAPADR